MTENESTLKQSKGLSFFEKYLTVWVALSIVAGILLGKIAPGFAMFLDGLAIYVGDAPVVSIPIAICLFFMMYPIMVKIDFGKVIKAGKRGKPVFLTLFINWAIKPFTMYAIATLFLGVLFRGFIGPEATDLVKMPFGLDLPLGAAHGAGTVVMHEGIKMLEVPLWRSYLAGCILLGIAPCTAMVLVWGYLARGNDGLDTNHGGDQFPDNVSTLWCIGRLFVRCRPSSRSLAGAVAVNRSLRCSPPGSRIFHT